jgi:autotransporter passenger strand-loop-strand repeat protein
VEAGGNEAIYGSNIDGVVSGHVTVYSGGKDTNALVDGGGSVFVSSGGTVSAATIASGTLELQSGAIVKGGITLTGSGGVLQIDGTTMPTAIISGFTLGQTIDLAGIAFDPAWKTKLVTDNKLKITENGITYNLNLDPAQDYTGATFTLSDDNHGGTKLVDPPAPTAPLANSITVSGNITVAGTAGPDSFVINGGFGRDTIAKFDTSQDVLQFNIALFANYAAAMTSTASDGMGNTVITYDANDALTLTGISPASLHQGNFHFG